MKTTRTRSKQPGSAPGSLVFVGQDRPEPVLLKLSQYAVDDLRERTFENPREAFPLSTREGISWLDFDGIFDVGLIERVGQEFGLHPLLLEDVLHPGERSKIEDYGEYLFVVLKMLRFEEQAREVLSEQISLVLGRNYLLSFREHPGDILEPIRLRLRAGKGLIRKSGADYLAYAVIDTVVDHYFVILERSGDLIEEVETEILSRPESEALHDIYEWKQNMISIRKSVWPLREVVNHLLREESDLVQAGTKLFLRDVYDHTIQVVEAVESTRDTLSGMLDLYLSINSNRMNEVMKVLTIIATIFIPLTFVAGIYGMNFQYMPELGMRWAYPVVWAVMIGVAGFMLILFRRKGWL